MSNNTSITIAPGSVVRLRGATRSYTAIVTRAEPNRVWLRIGDEWDNCYAFVNGEWVGVARQPGRAAPKTRIVGVLNRSEYVYHAK